MLQEGLFEEGLFADSRRARWPSPPCQLVRVDFRACRMHYFCCSALISVSTYLSFFGAPSYVSFRRVAHLPA